MAVTIAPPAFDAEGITLHVGDCREVMAAMEPESVDAIVTDPPYGLEFMGKEWDKLLALDRHVAYPSCRGNHGPNAYRAGLEAQAWHHSWAVEALRVLKPGGHLVAFGGTRTHHRLWCAVEDAGFEVRDTIGFLGMLAWVTGQGFPKSLDVSKAIDRAAGAEREVVGESRTRLQLQDAASEAMGDWKGKPELGLQGVPITAPATDTARQWQGWGTALKPAWEPILLARKPLSERTVAANVQKHGTGGLNIDGSRVGMAKRVPGGISQQKPNAQVYGRYGIETGNEGGHNPNLGRWPANLVLSCTCEETREGRVATGTTYEPSGRAERTVPNVPPNYLGRTVGYADPDGKEAVRIHTDPNCPCAMLDAQSGERATGGGNKANRQPKSRDSQVPPTQDTGQLWDGDSGGASRFFYTAKAGRGERGGSTHPTQKPLALMRWLCRLITPPNGLILDPFLGSGTTAVAAGMEGFRCIGIDQEEAYIAHAIKRLQIGDAGMRRLAEARKAGAEQLTLGEEG